MLASPAFADAVLVRGAVASCMPNLVQGGTVHHGTLGGVVADRFESTTEVLIVGFWFPALITTDVDEDITATHFRLALTPNVPNPFNPQTTIHFVVPGESGACPQVSLNIYDVSGRHVRTLVDAQLVAGPHEVLWDGMNDSGNLLGSGVYLARYTSGQLMAHKRLVLLK